MHGHLTAQETLSDITGAERESSPERAASFKIPEHRQG